MFNCKPSLCKVTGKNFMTLSGSALVSQQLVTHSCQPEVPYLCQSRTDRCSVQRSPVRPPKVIYSGYIAEERGSPFFVIYTIYRCHFSVHW